MNNHNSDGRVVIVGASLAATRTAQALRSKGYSGSIMLIGDEPYAPYDRPPLTKEWLTGKEGATLDLLAPDELQAAEIDLVLGEPATGLDAERKRVRVGAEEYPYDYLVVATGSRARRPPTIPSLSNILTIRTKDDGNALRTALRARPRIVIVGFGFIGSEIAASARSMGLEVTIVEISEAPFARYGTTLASRLLELHQSNSVDVRLGRKVHRFLGSTNIEAVELDDGTRIDADLVVMGVGSEPNQDWLAESGLTIDNGLHTDDTLLAAPDVFAAGDIASWVNPLYDRRMRVEHWTNATEQGRVVAHNLMNIHQRKSYSGIPYFWSDQYGYQIQLLGDVTEVEESQWIVKSDDRLASVGVYAHRGTLVGVAGINSARLVMRLRKLIQDRTDWQSAVAALRELGDKSGYRDEQSN